MRLGSGGWGCPREQLLMVSFAPQRLRKQAEKNVEKKIDRFTEVLKTHGFLV